MSSFDLEDQRAKYAVVPKSVNDGKVVQVSQKKLQTKKQVRTVLPEEKYIEKLEKIIVKDYFPELPKLQAQREYMDAVAANDVAKIRELQFRFRTSRRTDRRTSPSGRLLSETPGTAGLNRLTSPANFDPDTPGPSTSKDRDSTLLGSSNLPYSNQEGDNEIEKERAKRKKESATTLTQYLNEFTSEDNASFEELTEVMRERERRKRMWIYDAEIEHNRGKVVRAAIAADADVQLALKHTAHAEEDRPKELDNWKYTAWNTVLFNPDGAPLTAAEKIEAAKKQQIVINKDATRFDESVNKPNEQSMARAAMNQAANRAGKVDIMGFEQGVVSNTKLGLVATPSPAPGVEDSPLMTWGEIDGTPFRLDAPDMTITNAPTFKMPEVPYREQIAQGINDSIAQRYRDKRKVAMKAAEAAHYSPRFTNSKRSSEKFSLLSPAAQRLATSKLGIKIGSASGFGKSPKTPSVRTPGSARSTKRTSVDSMIRKRDDPTPKRAETLASSSITDGLLAISQEEEEDIRQGKKQKEAQRPTAGDFF